MDNPVEVAFTAEGEPFATVNILLNRPSRMDAIIYCIEGGVYPYMDKAVSEFKRTGDLLPAVGPLGWVAPSGLMRYRSEAFGDDYRGNLFSAQFNTRRVQRHPVERDGAAFRMQNEDFLVADRPISTRPTCWKTPTAACWSSTPAAGSASAVRRRRSPSPRSKGRSIACGEGMRSRRRIRAACNSPGTPLS